MQRLSLRRVPQDSLTSGAESQWVPCDLTASARWNHMSTCHPLWTLCVSCAALALRPCSTSQRSFPPQGRCEPSSPGGTECSQVPPVIKTGFMGSRTQDRMIALGLVDWVTPCCEKTCMTAIWVQCCMVGLAHRRTHVSEAPRAVWPNVLLATYQPSAPATLPSLTPLLPHPRPGPGRSRLAG